MKKILMTSGAALMLSAGYAAADVISFSGDARMGVVYDNNAENEFRIDSRIRGYFWFDAESDSGLEFGGRLRIDQAREGANSVVGGSAGNYAYVASEFGEVRVGDVAGAAQSAAGDLYGVGFTGLGFLNEPIYFQRNFAGGAVVTQRVDPILGPRPANRALYMYDLGDFSFYASTDSIDDALVSTNVSVGASYDMGMFNFGGGFEYFQLDDADETDGTHIVGSAEGNFDMFSVKGHFGRAGGDLGDALPSQNQFGASVEGTFDMITATAFARQDFFEDRHFGLGGSYDLGGGARIDAGVRHTRYDDEDADNDTFADIGVNMSF